MNAFKLINVCFLIVFTIFMCLNPIYPQQMLLQHSATFFAVVLLAIDLSKNLYSRFAILFFTFFIVLHVIGARWIYSFVPYDEWLENLVGWNPGEYFSFTRNHYDRFVHFMFGVLAFPLIVESIEKFSSLNRKQLIVFTFLALQTFSMIYELFEWSLTFTLSPEDAEGYNGQQGDMWDAHKDMALAMLGSGLMALMMLQKINRKIIS